MIDFIIFFIVIFLLNQGFLNRLKRKHSFFNKKLLDYLFFYHVLFFITYFIYAVYNPSDSKQYYFVSSEYSHLWLNFFDTGTDFISFIAIPFVKLGASYISTMFIFSWFGYLGFVYAYLLFKENIPETVKVFGGIDLLTLLLFLPNMHFWTASLGKGSVIFLGLMLFTYAVKYPLKRIVLLLIGGFLVYMIRPHVMLFVLVGVMIGLVRGREKINLGVKALVLIVSFVFLFLASDTILQVANLENSDDLIGDFIEFSDQHSTGLSEMAGSGVDMNNYSLPVKFFTFWFRPLFIDAPNALGLIISFENLVYILLFLKVINIGFVRFIFKAPYMVKMASVTFFLSTFALTFVMSNLGIIMRQKSMVMYFAFFVIYYYLAEKQYYKKLYLKKQFEEEQAVRNIKQIQ